MGKIYTENPLFIKLLSITVILMILFTNCDLNLNQNLLLAPPEDPQSNTEDTTTPNEVENTTPPPPALPDIEPINFKLVGSVSNCLEENIDGANACVFKKNPVADSGSTEFLPILNTGSQLREDSEIFKALIDLSHLQKYAVNIPGDQLENEKFIITDDLNSESLKPTKNNEENWKYPFKDEAGMKLIPIHLFFWVNHLSERVENITGSSYFGEVRIRVIPLLAFQKEDDGLKFYKNAFWSPHSNILAFGLSSFSVMDSSENLSHAPLALDTGIIAHEFGHALLDHSTNTPFRYNEELENFCGSNSSSLCSTSIAGSLGAINEGIGDILSFFLFPESTAIGELFYNNLEGLKHCKSMPRDVRQIKEENLDAEDLFNACILKDKPGEIHALGSVYSVIWYGVFQHAFQRGGEGEKREAYKLFFEHLKNLTYNDSFESARQMIKTIDKTLFEERFSEDLDTEYRLLGYDI